MPYKNETVEKIMSDHWMKLYAQSEKENLTLHKIIYALLVIIGILGVILLK